MIFELDPETSTFPDPIFAEPDGLLAVGGDLRPERLLNAYAMGIFPWYSEETPILWYAPHERFVLFPDELKISKSLRKVIQSACFTITRNRAFDQVIAACATQPRPGQDGTWITAEMQQAYIQLHQMGHAHSIEAWHNDKLVGGLYGVAVGQIFCGESMFSRMSNASKVALVALCQSTSYRLVDCQVYTSHLASLGAKMIASTTYQSFLQTLSR